MVATVLSTARWTPLDPHPEQMRFWNSTARFEVAAAGRRSGKTERAKRKGVKRGLKWRRPFPGKIVFSAPTRDQAKKIYWEDLKLLVPKCLWAGKPSESELSLRIVNGMEFMVAGMDRPERIEGQPIDGIVLDEYAAMRPAVWTRSVRPALSTRGREGWAMFIGKPKGRNHFWKLAEFAKLHRDKGWDFYTWPSSDILSAKEIALAKADVDELTYSQEYDANFITFEGRAYYPFMSDTHACERLPYSKEAALNFMFDFNVKPGIAAVGQKFEHARHGLVDGVIGEVWIPDNSNTRSVCRRLVQDWKQHQGLIYVWGDATGGARGTAKVDGSDWDIVKEELRPVFGERLKMRVPKRNPPERARVNVVNTRLMSADGKIRLLVDPFKAPHVVTDLEGVSLLEGGSGEIDKGGDPSLTHISDAVGYWMIGSYPPVDLTLSSEEA